MVCNNGDGVEVYIKPIAPGNTSALTDYGNQELYSLCLTCVYFMLYVTLPPLLRLTYLRRRFFAMVNGHEYAVLKTTEVNPNPRPA